MYSAGTLVGGALAPWITFKSKDVTKAIVFPVIEYFTEKIVHVYNILFHFIGV